MDHARARVGHNGERVVRRPDESHVLPRSGGVAGEAGATTVRYLWADLKQSVSAALDRIHPGVLIVTGLAAVALAFGALAVATLDERGSGLDDLGLGAPEGPMADGDSASGEAGVTGGDGDSLTDGLAVDGPRTETAAGRADDDAAADAPSGTAGSGAPHTTEARPAAGPLSTEGTTTSAPPPGTAPTTTATTVPPSSTTVPPTEDPGLIGGLLDLLGLGGS